MREDLEYLRFIYTVTDGDIEYRDEGEMSNICGHEIFVSREDGTTITDEEQDKISRYILQSRPRPISQEYTDRSILT